MNNELLRARLHAMRRAGGRPDQVSEIASQLAESARRALGNLPHHWDLSLEAADKCTGAAGLCVWAKGRKPRQWHAAAMLLRHALLIQAQPERVGAFIRALERYGTALVESERGASGGSARKHKLWAAALASRFADEKYEVAWQSIPTDGGIYVETDREQFEVYRDAGRIVAVNDATGKTESIARSTFERHYLQKARYFHPH